jgi:hypothetical protein
VTCKKAIGVAKEMKKKYGTKLELKIYTIDSEAAKLYNFKSSTNVLFQKEPVPIDIAIDSKQMVAFLSERLRMP